VGTHWELEEHVESPLIEMQWELHGNIMGKNKNPTLPPSCKRKKKPGPLGACCLTHWLQEMFLPICIICHFWPSLMAGA